MKYLGRLKPLLILLMLIFAAHRFASLNHPDPSPKKLSRKNISGDRLLERAFKYKWENFKVRGEGRVIQTLPDDSKPPRHQRFILRLASGQTLLVAHNIDLAPALESLSMGDRVQFSGQYQYNPQGGVIHHTHKNPKGRGGGWLRHKNRIYQ